MRHCFRDPIPEIAHAAKLLEAAVSAYALGQIQLAAVNVAAADLPAIRSYTKELWGKSWCNLSVPSVPASASQGPRMPGAELKRQLHERDGHHCRFCGIPLVRPEIRKHLAALFPQLKLWGSTEQEQHAALQVMWTQYDHVVPYSRGGATTLDNLVLTCAPCNFGRDRYLVEEVGLTNPRERAPLRTDWDGLTQALRLELPDGSLSS